MATPFKSKKGPAFEFPKLNTADLLHAFEQMGIKCEPEELKNPDTEIMKRIGFGLVEFMVCQRSREVERESREAMPLSIRHTYRWSAQMGMTKEELRAAPPQFAAMELMTHPELHEESAVELTLIKALYAPSSPPSASSLTNVATTHHTFANAV
jgi:hypothetical protein